MRAEPQDRHNRRLENGLLAAVCFFVGVVLPIQAPVEVLVILSVLAAFWAGVEAPQRLSVPGLVALVAMGIGPAALGLAAGMVAKVHPRRRVIRREVKVCGPALVAAPALVCLGSLADEAFLAAWIW